MTEEKYVVTLKNAKWSTNPGGINFLGVDGKWYDIISDVDPALVSKKI